MESKQTQAKVCFKVIFQRGLNLAASVMLTCLTWINKIQHFNFYWDLLFSPLPGAELRDPLRVSGLQRSGAQSHRRPPLSVWLPRPGRQPGALGISHFYPNFLHPSRALAFSLLSQSHSLSWPSGRCILKCQRFLLTPETSCHSWFTPENCSLLAVRHDLNVMKGKRHVWYCVLIYPKILCNWITGTFKLNACQLQWWMV